MKYIDIESVIRNSNAKVLKRIPRFCIFLVERIIYQKEINQILTKYSENIGASFLEKMIGEFDLTLDIQGKENLPENGKCFFVANHPFGVIDGLILTRIVTEKYGTLKAIGNDAFMLIPNLRPLIAAVNVYGRSSKEYIAELDKVYESDIPITHFPAGEVSRKYHGKVQDCPWQKSFIGKAIANQRNIVPFHFHGTNSRLFYTIGVIRNWLGIKLNIELLLLPREMFKNQHKTIKIVIKKPIRWEQFDKSKSHVEWAQKVREYLYNEEQTEFK